VCSCADSDHTFAVVGCPSLLHAAVFVTQLFNALFPVSTGRVLGV
jgi:hypothetical protein